MNKRMKILFIVMLLWLLVAFLCATFNVPFRPYGTYWSIIYVAISVSFIVETALASK